MLKQKLLLFLFCISSLIAYSQQKPWFKLEFQKKNYPSDIYYKQYAEGATKKEALRSAKVELSKSISTEINVSSTSLSVTKNAVLNDVFRESSSSKSSLSISGLEEKVAYTKKNKLCHVFIFIKKDDLKSLTKKRYDDLLASIEGDVNACQQMFNDRSYTSAKNKGDEIEEDKRKLKRLKNLLSVFEIYYDPIRFNNLTEDFEPLYAKIRRKISDEEDYKYNKNQGDLKALSNDGSDLESALSSYAKAEKINPNLALSDELPLVINKIKDELYKIYCQKGMNYEQEFQYPSAVNYYRKARKIYANKNIPGEKETTTDKIKSCQNQQIDILEKKGLEELGENPEMALSIFKDAKILIDDMKRIDRIKSINKLIKKAKRVIRRAKIKAQRKLSSKRLVLTLGGGLQTDYSEYSNIYTDPINFSPKNWNLSSTFGYRMNLPDVKKVTKTGREISRGNVLALFLKKGSANIDDNTANFTDIEFGYIAREWLRVSAGVGGSDSPNLSSYYTTTGGVTFHFGRLSTEFSVTYRFDNDFEPQEAKFNANIGLHFYLYKKIYKTTKGNIK